MNPAAGGAEVIGDVIASRLAQDGHTVLIVTSGFPGCTTKESVNGYRIVRLGNRFSVYWSAYRYYKKNLQGKVDLVIDEINTIPFFTKFYVQEKTVILCYQLCREIWFYQISFPLNVLGYILEPFYLWLLRDQTVLTESESTKKDLLQHGFKANNISIFPIGLEIIPVEDLSSIQKYEIPTMLYLSSLRSMKRPLHVVRAFEMAKEKVPGLRLVIGGDRESRYGRSVIEYIKRSRYSNSIDSLGRVSSEKKIELMQRSHVICVTSVKEGWGMIVTEANSQGTPAVVYNVDGLRDSVKNGITGLACDKNTPFALSKAIVTLLRNADVYGKLQQNAWEWSKQFTFQNSYRKFIDIVGRQ